MDKKTVKDHIINALDDLRQSELKAFRHKLCDTDFEEGVSIAKGKVEEADSLDLADIIVRTFSEANSVKVTVRVLRAIGENQVANILERKTGQAGEMSGAVERTGTTAGARLDLTVNGVHFVDRHREALIKRTPIVEPILDALLSEKMIHQELYTEIITATTPPQRKMRMLFLATTAWGTKQKDYFYKILEREQPFLIEELQTI
ncbi:apoptosis-associated speck-like protein containing a CARD [Acipenser oxyrinchus oxyrinchus]|uniref:Apoptosis-associated speck-like protein containing a CARD n=1 Tax=Acipenser oxyrinchus oxyrinchus TaxID=40147 RepID=A0AAD8CHY9_ACIOX|nr:apoptosis-associated speck-like protein containing a CARD [Acipenser oxyrinchus oxyrinchus]